MRSIKIGLALVAALAFSVAMTATASAESFLSSVTKAKLLSEKVASQIFTTSEGTVECSKAKVEKGETGTAGVAEASQLAEIKYEECLAFGFVPTEISAADYLFLADGEVHVQKLIKILSAGCEVSVPAQNLAAVKFSTSGNNIKLEPKVAEIEYTASKCTSNGKFTNGTYTGNSEVMIASGKTSFLGLPVELWSATTRYLKFRTVEWRANSGKCYESNQITEGEEPPSTPWDSVTCP